MTGRRGSITAAELKAEKERRLREDPEYRAQVQQVEAERRERSLHMREAEQPILQDLESAGCDVTTVWSLYELPDEVRARAIPVLLSHLLLDYPPHVVKGISTGLDFAGVRSYWSELRSLYVQTESEAVRDCLAAVLSARARRQEYDDLLGFVRNARLGESRIYFLRPINRIGNRIEPGHGRAIIAGLVEDATFAKEATAILKGRSRNE